MTAVIFTTSKKYKNHLHTGPYNLLDINGITDAIIMIFRTGITKGWNTLKI